MAYRIDLLTLFPDLVNNYCQFGVLSRALREQIIMLQCWNPRDFTSDRHATVDDASYGGGPGMVMKAEPLDMALRAAQDGCSDARPVIYLSPQGRRVDHDLIESAAAGKGLILLAGRYEGIDERLIEKRVDEEWSIGDFVVNGGELPALMVVEAVTRLLPGALGDDESALQDSFSAGLLDYPHYTRPAIYDGEAVPKVLLSGDHQAIAAWRMKQSLGRTWSRRPDLLGNIELSPDQLKLLDEFIAEAHQLGEPS
ncbi:MAG: tRNA (guanosine(37)-N1)-methyltransferase TrmD [Gammaproteobacteria bacterium]|nr:MAG: tRNA (guanosine(37)-N1)-methyltransferase TrmD [Gammaproteobacteria bacterium]RLA13546.1 MAG: tRNA (guanosine(37)-N1)-methyltransferase TrmD [Gammaproteobacteria bacterium]